MSNPFETENYKDFKQKEKMSFYILLIFLGILYYIFGFLNQIEANLKNIEYTKENIKIYKNALTNKNAISFGGNSSSGTINLEEVVKKSNEYINSINEKTLKYNDLNNFRYIEFFINYHLSKIGQSNQKIGANGIKFVNYSEQLITINVTTDKPKDITYLLNEFNNAGYLGGFEINKIGNLYECKIKLIFIVN